jgi:hypothetical protein
MKEGIMLVQKTYKGRTAGGWLSLASVGEAKCGITNIWIPAIPGLRDCQAILTDDGDMLISDSEGVVVCLETSDRAYRTLKSLESKADAENLARFAW